jgi:hypothetical protein
LPQETRKATKNAPTNRQEWREHFEGGHQLFCNTNDQTLRAARRFPVRLSNNLWLRQKPAAPEIFVFFVVISSRLQTFNDPVEHAEYRDFRKLVETRFFGKTWFPLLPAMRRVPP